MADVVAEAAEAAAVAEVDIEAAVVAPTAASAAEATAASQTAAEAEATAASPAAASPTPASAVGAAAPESARARAADLVQFGHRLTSQLVGGGCSLDSEVARAWKDVIVPVASKTNGEIVILFILILVLIVAILAVFIGIFS